MSSYRTWEVFEEDKPRSTEGFFCIHYREDAGVFVAWNLHDDERRGIGKTPVRALLDLLLPKDDDE